MLMQEIYAPYYIFRYTWVEKLQTAIDISCNSYIVVRLTYQIIIEIGSKDSLNDCCIYLLHSMIILFHSFDMIKYILRLAKAFPRTTSVTPCVCFSIIRLDVSISSPAIIFFFSSNKLWNKTLKNTCCMRYLKYVLSTPLNMMH